MSGRGSRKGGGMSSGGSELCSESGSDGGGVGSFQAIDPLTIVWATRIAMSTSLG